VKLLAFDAASTACSAALLVDGRIAAERFEAMERGQAEVLVPMIADVMALADVEMEHVTAIAVTVGPGAFTGVRIGLAAARGLCLARAIPFVGLTTFAAVAFPARTELRSGEVLVAAIESKRTEIFLQVFDRDLAPLSEPFAETPENAIDRLPAGPLLLSGDGAPRLQAVLRERGRLSQSGAPQAALFAPLAAERLADSKGSMPLRPFYMRPPDARPMVEQVVDG
jgi:tRNA threonylcarbamoyladenosine biosynthesis protein TsaB